MLSSFFGYRGQSQPKIFSVYPIGLVAKLRPLFYLFGDFSVQNILFYNMDDFDMVDAVLGKLNEKVQKLNSSLYPPL